MKKYLIIFFSIVLICVISFQKVNQFYITHALKLDGERFAQRMQNAIVSSIEVIDSLPPLEEVVCDKKSILQLANQVYRADSVRWLGLKDKNGNYCTSLQIDLGFERFQKHKLFDNYSLAVLNRINGHSDLLLIKEYGESFYLADLNNLSAETFNDLPCEKCIRYRVTVHGDPPIVFGDVLLKTQAYRFQLRRQLESLEITVVFEATNEISEYYSGVSLATTIFISCLLALFIVYTIERLLNYHRSFQTIIERAIVNGEFKPYYQPLVDCQTNEVVGAEALLRWVQADGSTRPTNEFIEFLEQTGLIVPITDQLIEMVTSDVAKFGWDGTDKAISLNIVPKHLENDNLFQKMQKAIRSTGIHFKNISLEITERNKVSNLPRAKRVIGRFISKGTNLYLDDAGTGYGGFSYIQELQISTLKIDKMFIDTIGRERDLKKPVLDAIIAFAKSSGLSIVAEGVETIEQINYLKSKGVFLIQGFIYCQPLSSEEFRELLKDQVIIQPCLS